MTQHTRFGFRIKTRNGLVVDNLLIQARDQQEAERRLRQMYQQCEILETRQLEAETRSDSFDLDGIISLIGKQDEPKPPG